VIIPDRFRFCSGRPAGFASLSIRVASIPGLAPGGIRQRLFASRPTVLGISKVGVLTCRVPSLSPKEASDRNRFESSIAARSCLLSALKPTGGEKTLLSPNPLTSRPFAPSALRANASRSWLTRGPADPLLQSQILP
jgi:hypothetical protein